MIADALDFRVFDAFQNKYSEYDFYLDQFGHLYYRAVTEKLVSLTLGNRFFVERCTGMKDKNGELIYEGDVVKAITGEIGCVQFIPATCGFLVYFPDKNATCLVDETQEIVGNTEKLKAVAE